MGCKQNRNAVSDCIREQTLLMPSESNAAKRRGKNQFIADFSGLMYLKIKAPKNLSGAFIFIVKESIFP